MIEIKVLSDQYISCPTMSFLQKAGHVHMIDHLNDTRIVAVITLILLTLFCFCGMEIASKVLTSQHISQDERKRFFVFSVL